MLRAEYNIPWYHLNSLTRALNCCNGQTRMDLLNNSIHLLKSDNLHRTIHAHTKCVLSEMVHKRKTSSSMHLSRVKLSHFFPYVN